MHKGTLPVVCFALFCGSCDESAIDSSQSLVGAKHLPSPRELANERIELYFGHNKDLSRQLSYEFRPDNRVIVHITDAKPSGKSDDQVFQLTPSVSAKLRAQLWRLRPGKLEGPEYLTEPADCPPPPTDTSSTVVVAFIAEGPKPGVQDDQVGVFGLPHPNVCNTTQAIAARTLLNQVMKLVPRSELRHSYGHNPPLP